LDSLPGDEGLLAGQFRREVAAGLPSLLDPLAEIAAISSDTAEHVKQKEQIYRRRFLPALRRFAIVGDLWSAEAMQASTIRPEKYSELLGLLGAPRKFDEAIASDWVQDTLRFLRTKEVSPFHWELAYPHVFLTNLNNDRAGFDVIIGNPPYDVLSERETGLSVDHVKRFIELDPTLEPSLRGKNNLYKMFVVRSAELLADGGVLSFIVPMPLLGDEQASGIRRMLLSAGEFSEIHAFPQKDNPVRRVFRDAKLSTALFVYRKLRTDLRTDGRFQSQVHPGQFIERTSPRLILNSNSINLYDPENLTIVSCSQDDWDLVAVLAEQPIARLRDFVTFFQGEVNQTVATARGHLTSRGSGPLITRGANISMYQLRQASQGEDIHLDVSAFLEGKGEDTKAFHHRFERIGLQESSPQNNFRRIISCRIPSGQFCNHKINYTTSNHSKISLELVLFVLNSSFADWYFRLGSTNAAVSHYQLENIPCPRFGEQSGNVDKAFCRKLDTLIAAKEFSVIEQKCTKLAVEEGCSPTVERALESLVKFIERDEAARGRIARSERSHLADDAEQCQVVLDKMMLILLGLSEGKHEYLRTRLTEML
jgi:Eco57I restriction-modification methylase